MTDRATDLVPGDAATVQGAVDVERCAPQSCAFRNDSHRFAEDSPNVLSVWKDVGEWRVCANYCADEPCVYWSYDAVGKTCQLQKGRAVQYAFQGRSGSSFKIWIFLLAMHST